MRGSDVVYYPRVDAGDEMGCCLGFTSRPLAETAERVDEQALLNNQGGL